MRIASFNHRDSRKTLYGLVQDNNIYTPATHFYQHYPTLRDLIEADAVAAFGQACTEGNHYTLDEVALQPPVPNARRVICVGLNYHKRYPVANAVAPSKDIILFAKLDGTLVGHQDELEFPEGVAANSFDYEGEIVCVVGRGGRNIRPEQALDHLFGFTIMNDGSVRDWQKQSIHAGKNFARSGSCGPWVVTLDEITDINSMRLTTRLNGKVVQQATPAEMITPIPDLIAYISHTIDLKPGDLIATGSPEGSGGSRTPPRFLKQGDRLDIEVKPIGTLTSQVSCAYQMALCS